MFTHILSPVGVSIRHQSFTQEDIDEAAMIAQAHGEPFNREGFEYVLKAHAGYFPVRIRAPREGSLIPVSNLLVDVINTDERCSWVTSFLETALLRAVWYPTTVATREYYLRRIIKQYLDETADSSDGLPFKLNDFGSRGASSTETSALGGLAHLTSFAGTDNVIALSAAMQYYGATGPVGFSIPAAEHSTMTSWGGREGEESAMRNMLVQFAKPGSLVAVVSDSYDLFNAVEKYWAGSLLDRVQTSGATVVVRPDSGNPVTTPVAVIQRLMDALPEGEVTVNSKGYKMLPSYFRVIQGDGVNEETIPQILKYLKADGISTDNIAFGMGGAMLQQLDRDTMKFAMKCSAIEVNGEWRDVYKDPITDQGKKSKKGQMDLVSIGGVPKTVPIGTGWIDNGYKLLRTVYQNGKMYDEQTFDEVRAEVNKNDT
jgi:nicotinamide phosphoribosyltransferase